MLCYVMLCLLSNSETNLPTHRTVKTYNRKTLKIETCINISLQPSLLRLSELWENYLINGQGSEDFLGDRWEGV